MTEAEIEDMKKELILLRMHKQRLESDLQKMQAMIRHLMFDGLSGKNTNIEEASNDGIQHSESSVGNGT